MNETPTNLNLQATKNFLQVRSKKWLLAINLFMSVVYFAVLAFWFPKGNPILFYALLVGEIFHLWQALAYIHTVWELNYKAAFHKNHNPPVDVFITVAGEEAEIVEATARAALNMDYPNFHVYLLNDGFVAKKDNWEEIEALAKRLDISCITRKKAGGAKAGNINHALTLTSSPLVAVFDADQVPHSDFLKKTAGYFIDKKMAFVQSPQYYKNFAENNVSLGAWEQQELFFGPICRGKNRLNTTFLCGTNMLISRQALVEAGGMCEHNIAEDFLTSLFIHERGWKSVYVPEVLAEGLAPEDFLSYYKQQFRWARGSLEVIFKYNPLFRPGLTWNQKIQYLSSASYYLSGLIVLVNALLPIVFFYTGWVPLNISTMGLAAIFLPYIFLILLSLQLTSNFTYTFRALAFSMGSFNIHIKALASVLTNQKSNFAVTSKTKLEGNFLHLTWPHIAYILVGVLGVEFAVLREGISPALISNVCWLMFNISVFIPFIKASMPKNDIKTSTDRKTEIFEPIYGKEFLAPKKIKAHPSLQFSTSLTINEKNSYDLTHE